MPKRKSSLERLTARRDALKAKLTDKQKERELENEILQLKTQLGVRKQRNAAAKKRKRR